MDALEGDWGLSCVVSHCSEEGPLLGRADVGGWGWRMRNRAKFKSPTPAYCEVFVGLKKKHQMFSPMRELAFGCLIHKGLCAN